MRSGVQATGKSALLRNNNRERRAGMRDNGFRRTSWCSTCSVRDVATYGEPHAFSEGIEYAFVNRKAVMEGGRITGATHGRVFKR